MKNGIVVIFIFLLLASPSYSVANERSIREVAENYDAENRPRYEPGVFDCSDMSFELFDIYTEMGYNCTLAGGTVYGEKTIKHMWLLVEKDNCLFAVETTNGEVFEEEPGNTEKRTLENMKYFQPDHTFFSPEEAKARGVT
jgi:hypothetical protein